MNKYLGRILLGVALVCGSTPLLAAQHHDRHANHRTHQSHDQRSSHRAQQSYDRRSSHRTHQNHDRREVYQRGPRVVYRSSTYAHPRHGGWYRRGGWVPTRYRQSRYVVSDWRSRRLRQPPRGYHYVRGDRGDFLLVAISTGIIASILAGR